MPPPVLVESFSTAVTNFSFFSFFLIFSLKEFSSVFMEGGVPPPVLEEVGGFFFWDFRQGTTPGRFWWKEGFCFTFRSWWWRRRPAIRKDSLAPPLSAVSY